MIRNKIIDTIKKLGHLVFIGLALSCQEPQLKLEPLDFTSNYKSDFEIEEDVKKSDKPWKHQISASEYARKGNYKKALEQWDIAFKPREVNISKFVKDSIAHLYKTVNAKAYIIEEAKKHKVIIINEAHHNSLHRNFIKSILKDLSKNGYKYLGLEAMFYEDDSLKWRRYPIQKTGFYIQDPQFGNLVREAIDLGFTIFPYESKNDKANGKLREIEQAKNIQNEIEAHKNEKFIIVCGFDHALEGNHRSWEKALAGRLKEYTEINPFTIDQVNYSERSEPKYNRLVTKAFNFEESSVLIGEASKPYRYERKDAYTDVAVFHPNTKYIDGRPSWVFEANKKIKIPLDAIEISFPIMILAFKKGEDIEIAIPIDIIELDSKQKSIPLALKSGDYNIVITNGEESIQYDLTVD